VDQNAPLRGASTVNDELEVGFDEKFELGWSRLERYGRLVMCLVVAAGLAGLLGAGPLDHARCGSPGTGAADYQPIARFGTATQVTLHLPPMLKDGQAIVTVSSSFVEPFGLQSIHPTPVTQRSDQGNLQFTFDERGGGLDNYVRISGMPAQIGPIHFIVEMPGRTLRFGTFVLP
jgi:hypothetical protein